MFVSDSPSYCASAAWPRLLGDIGGTNARLGWQSRADAEIEQIRVLPVAEYPDLLAALESYLDFTKLGRPQCAALGMANPVSGDTVAMTNHHWRFSIHQVRAQMGWQRLLVLNDFTALALALPHLEASVKVPVGAVPQPLERAAIGLIGPGTGLGVSGLLPVPGTSRWVPIVGEGGHVSLSPSTAEEFAVLEQLQRRYGHASAERALSGAGLVDLYHALSRVRGLPSEEITAPAHVMEQGLREGPSLASDTLDLFCAFLGSVAGDLALTLGARGGLYLGGGIVPRMKDRFVQSTFRARFEAKGRFRSYLAEVPTWLIDAPVSPALKGAALALALYE